MAQEKQDYGKTLNLPTTEFPMRGNLPQREPKIQEEVFEKGLYEKMLNKNKGKTPFVLHDGPPYANGEIHTGHALNKILKDTVVRYKNLRGYDTPYIPGFDTHGLPTEKRAIQVLGINRDAISINEFRDICKNFALDFVEKQKEGFKRLGILGDWEHPYITLQPEMEAGQIGVFGDMYQKGYIYKGLKPVYWCTDCETALAEAEIEYKNITSHTAYVKFPVVDGKGVVDTKDTYFVIWTTTPWTLPGNMGITIGPDFDYSMVEVGEQRYILAHELVDKVMEIAGIKEYKIVQTWQAKQLEGILCKHPFLDRTSKVVLGSDTTILVELDTGTGAVHTAPGYGKEDYLCGLKNGLDIVVTIDEKGHQTEGAGPFAGMYYAKSDKEIIKWLQENGYLLVAKDVEHSYPHCWRCKKPVIYRATNQWFASVDGFRKETLEAIKKVKWIPSWGEERITNMIQDRNDWCISRQRTWGVPIPVFYCEDCKKEYITKESLQKVQEIFKKQGSNAWFALTPEELMPQGAKCEHCGSTHFKKETDIMDVWFDSGSTHQSVLVERGLPYPADLYLEGSDQYRGWFQSSLLTSIATQNKAPYKAVLTHGFIIDEEGRKMSKSLGNGIAPSEVIDEYGTDILRLWVLSSDFKGDVGISKDILKQTAEVYRKIRNTARYILGNIADFDVNQPVAYEQMEEIDKWALLKLNQLIKECTKSFDEYDFHIAYRAMNQFCVSDMSNFYLDIIKDRLYTYQPNSIQRRSAQTAMYEILSALVRMLAPMTCYTAEEIWQHMPHKKEENQESVMLVEWPVEKEEYENKELEQKWKKLIQIKEIVAKELELARAQKLIGHSLNAKVVLIAGKEEYLFLKENEEQLLPILIVSQLEIQQQEEAKTMQVKVEVAAGQKCERCWMYSTTVGEDEQHPSLCHRCVENLK